MVVDWREVDVADYSHFLPKPHDRDDLSDHDHCRFLHSSKLVCVIRPMILESASHTGGYPDIFLPFRHLLKLFRSPASASTSVEWSLSLRFGVFGLLCPFPPSLAGPLTPHYFPVKQSFKSRTHSPIRPPFPPAWDRSHVMSAKI